MTNRRNPNVETAAQYLVWALEEIERAGRPNAAHHARLALEELGGVLSARREAEVGHDDRMTRHFAKEAKRFLDKADEAAQLAELANSASRRQALLKIVEVYRRTAQQMDQLVGGVERRTTRK
ncbi:hypothetical protein [Bradyrhizobium sp. STM 3843]|uniref:hypothetical protein n=1 Tax=Bradyrhizobium sp. STM 3843 TaxID=551947 RepID=UPI00055F893A|nr:hypothetical protein [Bradyrhizobium sp. STM 3843]